MTPIEILAVIFAAAILIKCMLFLANPKWALGLLGRLSRRTGALMIISLIASVATGYFVISKMGIVSVMAAMLFAYFLTWLSFIRYPKSYTLMATEIMQNKQKMLLAMLIWMALAAWLLTELFLA